MPLSQPDPALPSPTPHTDPRLRDIVGGYSISRWPIKVDVAQNETPMSWLRRVSHRYQLTPRQLFEALGIKLTTNSKITVLLKQHSHSIEAALDIQVDDFNTAGFAGFRSPWLASFTASAHRFCPACLEDNGYWNAAWRSPLSIVCPRHQILYVDRCPKCGQQPWRTDTWLGQCAAIHICTARLPGEKCPNREVRPWCGFDLREVPHIPVPETVLHAQATITESQHQITQTSAPTSLRRFGIGPDESREVLATLIGAAWTQTQSESLADSRHANALHAGMTAYQELTSIGQPTPHLDRLRDTMNLDQILLGGPDNVGLYGPVIAAWYIDSIRDHLTHRKQLGWRTGRKWPSLPADPTAPWVTTHARLPEHRQWPICVPSAWVPQLLTTTSLQLPWESDPVGRALAAMCLLNLGRGIRWAYIALELGLPAHLQHLAAQRLITTSRAAWRRFLSALEDTFTDLCQSPPQINYRLRRIVGADPDLIRYCVAKQVCCEPQDIPQNSVAAVWAAYTGGDVQFAPPGIISKPRHTKTKKMGVMGVACNATDVMQGVRYTEVFEDLDAVADEHLARKQHPPSRKAREEVRDQTEHNTGCIHTLLEQLVGHSDELKFLSLSDVHRLIATDENCTQRALAVTFGLKDARANDVMSTLATSWLLDDPPVS